VALTKRFDRSLYDLYDQKAKEGAIVFALTAQSLPARENPARYGVDVLYGHDIFDERGLEAEVKVVWEGGPFPYENINVLGRKAKYFSAKCDLILFAKNLIDYAFIDGASIMASPKEVVSNKYMRAGEEFFKVHIDDAVFGKLTHDLVPCACGSISTRVDYRTSTAECMDCGKKRKRYLRKKSRKSHASHAPKGHQTG